MLTVMPNTKEDAMESKNKLQIILTVCLILTVISCSENSPSAPPAPMGPRPGSWAGDDISFTVNVTSDSVSNFSVSYSGFAVGTNCSFSYESTTSLSSRIKIENDSFSLNSFDLTIAGTFTDPRNSEIQVSWSGFDSFCIASYSGTKIYTASHQSSTQF